MERLYLRRYLGLWGVQGTACALSALESGAKEPGPKSQKTGKQKLVKTERNREPFKKCILSCVKVNSDMFL